MTCELAEQLARPLLRSLRQAARCGDDSSHSNYRTAGSSFHHPPVCQTRLVYRDVGGATVTAAGLSGPPDRIRKDLLQWLVFVCQASFVVFHSDHASLVRIRRAKAHDNISKQEIE